jgi:hypothetical protein
LKFRDVVRLLTINNVVLRDFQNGSKTVLKALQPPFGPRGNPIGQVFGLHASLDYGIIALKFSLKIYQPERQEKTAMKETSMGSGQDFETSNILLKAARMLGVKTQLHHSGIVKIAGYSAFQIVMAIFSLLLKGTTIGAAADAKALCMGKDAIYRLITNCRLNWRSFQTGIGRKAINIITKAKPDANSSSPNCLIIDDTFFKKVGWKIECSSICYDHTLGKSMLGLKCLVLAARIAGVAFPLDFSMHSEKKHDNCLSAKKEIQGLLARKGAKRPTSLKSMLLLK